MKGEGAREPKGNCPLVPARDPAVGSPSFELRWGAWQAAGGVLPIMHLCWNPRGLIWETPTFQGWLAIHCASEGLGEVSSPAQLVPGASLLSSFHSR